MAVTLLEVAKEAKVSPSTVSRVVNDVETKIRVGDDTRKRILDICEELKFHPNAHARSLFTNKTETIALVIPPQPKVLPGQHTFADSNIAECLSGIEETITARNYQLLLLVDTAEFVNTKKYIRLFRNKSIDSMLIWGLTIEETYIMELWNEDAPFILVNSYLPQNKNVNYVIADNSSGSFKVTEHLIKLGHKKIGYIRGNMSSSAGIDREKGYKIALEKYSLNYENLIEDGDFSEESGCHAMKKLLALKDRPTAIVAANDYMAIGAIEAIWDAGLKVPEDIAVIGSGNMESPVGISLTTIDPHLEEAGKLAVQMVVGLLNKEYSGPSEIIMKPELIIRESTG